jgi:hypothetical protein
MIDFKKLLNEALFNIEDIKPSLVKIERSIADILKAKGISTEKVKATIDVASNRIIIDLKNPKNRWIGGTIVLRDTTEVNKKALMAKADGISITKVSGNLIYSSNLTSLSSWLSKNNFKHRITDNGAAIQVATK